MNLICTARLASVVAYTLLAAACGGGGGSSGDSAPVADSAASAAAVAAVTCGLSAFQTDVMQQVNARRAAGATCGARGTFAPAPALAWNDKLAAAAAAHSNDMVAHNFFSHTGSDGNGAGTRMTAAGYPWISYGENIAAGYSTVQSVMDGWMASDGHCVNIMNPQLTEIGVACVLGTTTNAYGNYWTMDLATR